MRFRERPFKLYIAVSLFLVLVNCRQEQPPPAAVEAAILSQDWTAIDVASTQWMARGGSPRAVAILRGYAALLHGDPAATRHFLRARSGRPRTSELRWLEELAARHTDCAAAQLLGADALARRGERQAALAHLDAALVLDSNFALARLARGMLRAIVGNRAGALQDLDALPGNSSVAAEAMAARGLVKLDAGELAEAMADLDAALMIEPEHAVALNARGVAYAKLSAWAAAADDFQMAYQLAPELSEAQQNWRLAKRIANEHGTAITEQKRLTLVVTDLGSNNWSPKLKMGDDFSNAKAGSVIPNLSKRGQILIPMPDDKAFPKTALEREKLRREISNGIIQRVEAGGGLKTYELRLVQNINTLGYFDKERQAKVKQFEGIALGALNIAKKYFTSQETRVDMPLIGGSNGGHAAAEVMTKLGQQNPIDRVLFIDSRAKVVDTRKVIEAVHGNFAMISTKGDALAGRDRVANFETAKALKREHPEIRVFQADPKGLDFWIKSGQVFPNHILAMKDSKSPLSFKEFTGKSLTPAGERTGWSVMSELIKPNGITRAPAGSVHGGSTPGGVLAGPTQMARSAAGQVVFSASSVNGEFKLVYPLFGKD